MKNNERNVIAPKKIGGLFCDKFEINRGLFHRLDDLITRRHTKVAKIINSIFDRPDRATVFVDGAEFITGLKKGDMRMLIELGVFQNESRDGTESISVDRLLDLLDGYCPVVFVLKQ